MSLIRKILAAHKNVIGVFCIKGARAQWIQCILKIMFKFMFSEMAETNTKRCQIKSKSALRNTEYEGA